MDTKKMCALFGAWYLAGSIISTFLTGTLVVKLQAGLTQEQLGSLMAIAALPWVFKPIWGALIDRFKSMYWWAMAASVVVALSVLGLGAVGAKTSYWLIVAVVLLPNILRSLQDVAVDGLAVAVSREDQRGAIQMWMRIGTIAGTLLGGAGAMWMSTKAPWKEVCVAVAMISVLVGVIVPRMLASVQIRESRSEAKVSWKDFTGTLKSPMIILGLSLAVFSLPAQQITYPVFYKWWSSGHYEKNMVTVIFLWVPLFQFIGAVLGGLLVKKIGKAWAVILAIGLVTAVYMAIGFKSDWSQDYVMSLTWMTALVDTVYAVALFALLMDLADKRFTAMSFAMFMAGTNLCGVWGNWLGGVLSGGGLEVDEVFLLAATAQVLVIPIVIVLEKSRRTRANAEGRQA